MEIKLEFDVCKGIHIPLIFVFG